MLGKFLDPKNDEILEKVCHELDRFYWTDQELLDYDQAEKAKNDYISSLMQSRLEGKAEGKAEGEVDKGRKVAVEMLMDNEPESKIIKYTGLSSDEIAEIKKSWIK